MVRWRSMRRVVMLGVVASLAFGPISSRADLVNQKLVARVQEVERASLHIKSESEGFAYLNLLNHSFVAKSQFVFFRRRGTRLQMIAMGTVEGERANPQDRSTELVVNINKDSIVKYPQVGDLAVPLSDPMATPLAEKHDQANTPVVEDKSASEPNLPGYIELGMGIYFGRLSSDGAPQVGGGKNSQLYRFQQIHFEYLSGVLPIGISYHSHGGNLPTQDYHSVVVQSSESVSQIDLYYRFWPIFNKKLSLLPKLFTLSDSLKTDNTGSELFSTDLSAFGLGLRAQFQFASDLWKPVSEPLIAVQPLSLFTEVGYSPFVTAKDATPSRGSTSSGSTLLEYRLGATVAVWLRFVPIFKRWIVQGSWGARNYSLSFQGPTVSEAGNPVTVPPGISTNESEKDYQFFVGIRFGDPF